MMNDPDKLVTEQEGNRRFSIAMIALEGGDFNKSERLLRETIDIMGYDHPVALLAMKTLAGIASEQGRHEDALKIQTDLLDAQIATFGVNHSESARTVRNILDLCKELGKEDMANDIALMVQAASDMEKIRTTQSFRRLRTNPEDEELEKETLRHKIQKWIAGRFAKLFKLLPFLDPSKNMNAAPYVLILSFALTYCWLFIIGASSPNDGAKALRHKCMDYSTADLRRKLQFTSPHTVELRIDSNNYSAPFKVVGYNWQDLGTVATSSVLDKENWLIQLPEGLRDLNNNVYYQADAPEREIVHHMREVMSTSNYYYEHKLRYPKKIEQISETNFQYLNPFTRKLDNPSIQNLRLDDRPAEYVADFLFAVRNGGTWPGEPELYRGAIHCCRVSYAARDGAQQQFLVHGCDRYGRVMTASEGLVLLLQSELGKNLDDKTVLPLPQRIPTFWVLKVPPGMMLETVPYLKFRFAWLFGLLTAVLLFVFFSTPDKRAKAAAAVFFVCSMITFLASLAGALIP